MSHPRRPLRPAGAPGSWALVLLALLGTGTACAQSRRGQPAAGAASPAAAAPPKREPANVMSWEKAAWLEREGRAESEKPEVVIEAMELRRGDDRRRDRRRHRLLHPPAGQGGGAHRQGLAEDIQPQMLDLLKQNTAKEGIANIITDPRHRDRSQAPRARHRPPPAGGRLPRVPEARADARHHPRLPGARRHGDPGRVPPRRATPPPTSTSSTGCPSSRCSPEWTAARLRAGEPDRDPPLPAHLHLLGPPRRRGPRRRGSAPHPSARGVPGLAA